MEGAVPDADAPDTCAEATLWQRWRQGADESARGQLMQLHLPYARMVAATLYGMRMNNAIDFDDYLQLARVALIESIDRFDPTQGARFRTFASRRLHGAMLDGIERMTEVQQQLAFKRRLEGQRRASIKQVLTEPGAHPSHDSASTDKPIPRALDYVAEAGLAFALSWLLDGSGMVRGNPVGPDQPFYRNTQLRQARAHLLDLVYQLPPQELRVIHHHYLQELPFDDVARLMGLSKARISQLHGRALRRLRENLSHPDACNLYA